jgi:hypothetical protein
VYTLGVWRVLTIALAVVVMLSCVIVVTTPDPVDDISGILHQRSVRGHKLLAAPPAQLRRFVLTTFRSLNHQVPALRSNTSDLLALVCVRLC